MKIAVLSDIHGNGIALSYAIKDFKNLGINKIIILGDVVMKGPMPSQVMELLNDKSLEILAWIKGNTDMWFEEISETWMNSSVKERQLYLYYKYAEDNLKKEQILFIKNLPLEYSLLLNEFKILCVHGKPKSIVEAIDDSVSEDEIRKAINGVNEQVILCGHSHTCFIGEVNNKKIFNVGSIGNSLDGDNRISYGILDISKKEIKCTNRRIEYPINEIIDISIKNKFPLLDEYKSVILTACMNLKQ
ncbi:metallophosphoesterase family protein [Clostridium estertheticum]|uniref:metallophosphoesterase family protein n=1 Tax=Clostridium estertheticum TaxID=238834 RepID=UPI001C0D6218|nr:YfcE family phosphodiesterase [Clostridium estertheticum]MBU3171204.1 metallophosphatase family protein [Clostridium estertheticum]